AGPRREPEAEPSALRQRAPRGPGPTVRISVEAHAGYVGGLGGGAGRVDLQPAAPLQPNRRMAEERAADRQQSDSRDLRIEAERAEHVPGGELAEVVVARIARRRGGVEAQERAACRGLGFERPSRPVIERGDVEVGLVAEQRMAGVGRPYAAVDAAQEAVEATRRRRAVPDRPEEAGGVVRDHPRVLVGVALDEAPAPNVVVVPQEGAAAEPRLDLVAVA